MNTGISKPQITLEEITRQKKAVRLQIREQRDRIQQTATELFSPVKATTKVEMLMNSVNSGIAVFDGVMTGLRIMRRVRGLFRLKK